MPSRDLETGSSRCRLCGREADVAAVPAAHGDEGDPAKAFGLTGWLGRGRGSDASSGAHTLCPTCNETVADWYLPEFRTWSKAGAAAIASGPSAEALDGHPEPTWATAELTDVRPARFLKQLIAMLVAIAPAGFAVGEHSELAGYGLAPGRRGLPPRYQLYLALYRGPFARFVGYSAQLNPISGRPDELLEIAYPPFSCVLSLGGPVDVETTNISEFAELSVDDRCMVDLDLLNGFGHTPFPADFRTRAAVERDREADRRAA